MKVKVNEDRKMNLFKGTGTDKAGTQNENDATELEIVVPEQYQDFNKKIVFITDDGVVWDIIENNTYKITNAITKHKSVKFYIWLTKDNQDFRSEEKTLIFNNNTNADKEITEEEIGGVNKVINLLESEITKVTDLENEVTELITDIQNKLDNGEFNGKDGVNGKDGQNGKDGNDGKSAYEIWIEQGNEGTEQDFLDSLKASGTGEGSCLLTEVTITIDESGGESTTVPVTKLELDYTSVELEVGQGMQLACSVIPSNATNNAITWSSSDSTKVKVEEGYITALSSGNATITAKSVENSSIKASCSVKVTGTETGGDEGETTIDVTNITLDKTSLSLKVDETATLIATVLPTNATNKNVVWSSSDNSKATVSNGVVTALAEGNVTITARSQSNTSITATCSVTIEAKETGGETTGKKVYLYDLSPVKEGSILKKDGKTEFAVANGNYYSIPYSEGMYIITGMNRGWVTNYPPIIVEDGGTITIPETTKTEAVYYNLAYGYSATLTGFSENAKVYVNTYNLTEAYREKVYYIVGGAE